MLAVVVVAGGAGLWWARAEIDGLDVGARLSIRADGRTLREELAFDPDRLGEHELEREVDDARLRSIEAEDEDEVLVLHRPDDGLTVRIAEGAGSPVVLTYEVDLDEDDLGTLNAPFDALLVAEEGTTTSRAVEAQEHLRVRDEPADDPPWSLLGLAVGVLALLGWLAVLRRARRTVAVDPDDGLPSTHSPAEVGWLLRHGRVTVEDLAATLVDLTARGFVVPHRRGDGLVLGQGRPPLDLRPHEARVLDWLFADWAREADLDAQRARIREQPDRWAELWRGFVDDVEELGQDADLIERDVASTPVLAAAATGLGLVLAGTVGTAHGETGWLAALVAGALVLTSATAFARRTPEGETLAARWEAFGDCLREGRGLTPHALAYAVTLGEEPTIPEPEGGPWPAQLVHAEVERHVIGWREAYLTATSVRGEPSERVRALLSLRALRRHATVA